MSACDKTGRQEEMELGITVKGLKLNGAEDFCLITGYVGFLRLRGFPSHLGHIPVFPWVPLGLPSLDFGLTPSSCLASLCHPPALVLCGRECRHLLAILNDLQRPGLSVRSLEQIQVTATEEAGHHCCSENFVFGEIAVHIQRLTANRSPT